MAASTRTRNSRPTNSRRTTPKQRRQQHVLDVTVRVDQAAQQRKRRFVGVLSKFVIVLGLGAGLYYAVSIGWTRLFSKNPEYNLADVSVETDGVLTPAAVIEASDLHRGVNIFRIDLLRAKARVEALAQVEEAQVTRKLPNKISIQITERKPVAWIAPDHGPATRDEIAASPKSFLIDPNGVLLQPGKALPQDYHLPIIRNFQPGTLAPGAIADGEEIKAALDLIHAQQESLIGARFQIQEIDLSKHYGLSVLGESGVQVLFDLDDMDKQLKRLDVYLQTLEGRGQRVATINLLPQKNIPVTFITEPAPDANPAGTPGTEAVAVAAISAPGNPAKTGAPASKAKERSKSKPAPKEKSKPKARVHESKPAPKAAPVVRRALPVTPTP